MEGGSAWPSWLGRTDLCGERFRGEEEFLTRDGSEAGIFTGKGNRGPGFFFLRLGRRKKVVVVDTVWVVVVVAYTPWSPTLPSDRDDSESLDTGKASEELESSP